MNQLAFFGDVHQPRHRSALARKSNGQWLALKRAGKLWIEDTLCDLERFLKSHEGDFTFEQFRLWCLVHERKQPESVNAWGALTRVAFHRGICKWTGRVAQAKRPASHARLIKVWEAA